MKFPLKIDRGPMPRKLLPVPLAVVLLIALGWMIGRSGRPVDPLPIAVAPAEVPRAVAVPPALAGQTTTTNLGYGPLTIRLLTGVEVEPEISKIDPGHPEKVDDRVVSAGFDTNDGPEPEVTLFASRALLIFVHSPNHLAPDREHRLPREAASGAIFAVPRGSVAIIDHIDEQEFYPTNRAVRVRLQPWDKVAWTIQDHVRKSP